MSTRPTRADWMGSGAPISGSTGRRRAATSKARGGAATTNTPMPEALGSPHDGPAAAALRGRSLAAAPVLAGMALLTARSGAAAPFVCLQTASALGGMTAMYALM